MPVFISYHRPDEQRAKNIHLLLRASSVEAYLDVLDPQLQGHEGVTKRIVDALERCTHLLAMISNTTVASWWVPFEVGVATEKTRRITSYDVSTVALPEFLKIWPVITNSEGLNRFIRRYKEDSSVLKKSYKMSEAARSSVQTASDFHRLLKSDLGQR
jgi:hypothetical protein